MKQWKIADKNAIRKRRINAKTVRNRTTGIKILAMFLTVGLTCGMFTACGKEDGSGTRVVFTTGFGKDEIFRIGDEACKKSELMVYLTTTQNQYENVYGAEIWNTSLDGVTLEENVITGGFGQQVTQFLTDTGQPIKVLQIAIPDQLVEQGSVGKLR